VQKMAWYALFCLIMGPFKGKVPVFARLWPVRVSIRVSFTTVVVWSAILATAGLLVICLLAYPENHMAKLCQIFCAHRLMWPGPGLRHNLSVYELQQVLKVIWEERNATVWLQWDAPNSPQTASSPLTITTLKMNLSLVSNLAPLPELQVLQSFQLQGALPPDPLTVGSAPGPPMGSLPQTPIYAQAPALAMTYGVCVTGPAKYFGLGPGKAIIQPWMWPWFGPHSGLLGCMH